jgi:threo-3-hydroxy-L-aspartate ammonia-lyase
MTDHNRCVSDPQPELPFSIADVDAAMGRLRGHVHRTPMLSSRILDDAVGASVVAKSEHLQRTGSFKIRGALNRMLQLTPEEAARGVVAFSSGNHAQGVALAGQIAGVACTIVMPFDAPEVKKAATRGYGATIVEYDRYEGGREVVALEISERTGATLIHPFNDPQVAAGQGTCGLEVAEDFPDVEVAIIPVGGGGLISGMATALRARLPGVRIIGIEPEVANDAQQSMAAGRIIEIPQPKTVADGVASPAVGPVTFAVIQALVDEIITVPEQEILDATKFIATHMKQLLEPTGALTSAALLNHRVPGVAGRRVLTLFCGGNADLSIFAS